MFKKIASIAIAAMMLGSTAAIAASAVEAEEAVGADETAAVGAEDTGSVGAEDTGASTGSGSMIYFDANSSGWQNFSKITLFLYTHADGNQLITWGSKKGNMTDEGNGKWSFDLEDKGFPLDGGTAYGCIFTADWGMQTCDLIIGPENYGDTAYCTGEQVENNVDSNKKSYLVKWQSGVHGNPRCITSIGNVIGDDYWPGETGYSMLVNFMKSTGTDGLENAIKFNGKTKQATIDDTAKTLGLSFDDVKKAVAEAGIPTSDWDPEKSSLKEGGSTTAASGGGGSSTTTKTTSSSGTTSTSTTTATVTSGEGTTVYFIIGGVMLAAIGVFFLARKKREY